MSDNRTDDPDAIAQEIERTQDQIGDTVEQLEETLTPANVSRSILGDDGQEMVREGLRLVRDNPIPVALIAVGAVWLFATSDSPLVRRMTDRASRLVSGIADRSDEVVERAAGPPPAVGEDFDRRPSAASL